MEISLREWLIIGGIIVIALILFDGWRRIRANRNQLRIDIDKTIADIGQTSHHNPELPNGGARVSSFMADPLAVTDKHTSRHTSQSKHQVKNTSVQHASEPERQSDVEFSAAVGNHAETQLQAPVSTDNAATIFPVDQSDEMDAPRFSSDDQSSVDFSQAEPKQSILDNTETPLSAADVAESEAQRQSSEAEDRIPENTEEKKSNKSDLSGLDPLFDEIPSESFDQSDLAATPDEPNLYLDLDLEQPIHQIMANKAAITATTKDTGKRTVEKPRRRQVEKHNIMLPLDLPEDELVSDMGLSALQSDSELEHARPLVTPSVKASSTAEMPAQHPEEPQMASAATAAAKSAAAAARKALTNMPDPDEVLVITVVGRDRHKLPGVPLKQVVEACGMEFGDMSIYHRFEGSAAASSLQFSMANAVNPGTFDPDAMEELETPAVSFFMSMREPKDPMTAYECMLATAETLAKHLDGDLLDEDRSVMREQTKEHYRQRIRDFEMQSRRRKLGR